LLSMQIGALPLLQQAAFEVSTTRLQTAVQGQVVQPTAGA
jgi:hypothetical protein